jgi:large subunit ribosomal protein L15
MELHQLKPKHKLKKKKRVGRGGKRGTYSGRGIKGQRSRAGRKFQPLIRELIKKYPKLRGYRFNPKAGKQELGTAVLNLGILEKKFKSQEKITPQLLLEKKLIRRMKGRVPRVKILGDGKLTKSLVVEGCQVSKQAKEKIEKAGGKIL